MGVLRERMETEMRVRGFAARTQRCYAGWMRGLVKQVKVPADQITESQAREYCCLARKSLTDFSR